MGVNPLFTFYFAVFRTSYHNVKIKKINYKDFTFTYSVFVVLYTLTDKIHIARSICFIPKNDCRAWKGKR